jgi:hypothetical protein
MFFLIFYHFKNIITEIVIPKFIYLRITPAQIKNYNIIFVRFLIMVLIIPFP